MFAVAYVQSGHKVGRKRQHRQGLFAVCGVIICPIAIAYSMGQIVQDAQLSQRDRAAGCVIVFAKSRRLELGDNIFGHYRSIFNHCDIIGLKICRIT